MTTTSSPHTPTHHEPPPAVRATGIVVGLCVVIAIVALAFALPAAKSGPHDVPIGVAGPQAANGQVAAMLEQRAPGAFAVTYYPGKSNCATPSATARSTAACRWDRTAAP